MPTAPPKPCRVQNCPGVSFKGGYCDEHAGLRKKEDERPSAARRGYGHRWRKLRRMILANDPVCSDPGGIHAARGEVVVATDVDHIIPKRHGGGDGRDNLQPLCHQCHSRKTAVELGWSKERE